MAVRRISGLDGAWLLLERADMPMHVGALLEFSKPAESGPDFLRNWNEHALQSSEVASPFNLVPVRAPLIGSRVPALWESDEIDLDHHVRLWGLPGPAGQRELGTLVSALHSQPLDLRRPLWELHLIDGLEGDRFAMFFKLHHSMIDGTSGMRHIARTLSAKADERDRPPIWSVPRPRSSPSSRQTEQNSVHRAWRGITGLVGASQMLRGGTVGGRTLRAPYGVPASPLGARINGHRRLATQQFELAMIQDLAKRAGCTLNDVVLYLSGTALRAYLLELEQLPRTSLTAGVPVNLREAGDERPGTLIGSLVAELGTDIEDPLSRLESVAQSASAAKHHLRTLPEESLPFQAVLVNGPYIAGLVAGLGRRAPVPFSLGISNVPGPKDPLYLDGARLEGMYPVSLLMHGNALNVTCVSYNGRLNFGIVGARDALPHLQRLAIGLTEAVDELSRLLLGKD